jgi:putative transposase
MPRRARLTLAEVPMHVIQRGNNRSACFHDDRDRELYLGLVGEHARKNACAVHAYVLMTNHVHLLLTPSKADSTSGFMKALGERYVAWFNRRHRRTGSLWEGRFRSSLVETETYLLTCYRYIELNPVRARMVGHARDYRWSSYGANADGQASLFVQPHALYTALAARAKDRRAAYRALVSAGVDDQALERIRHAANGGFALGSDAFVADVEAALKRRARAGVPGRPARPAGSAAHAYLW